MPPILDVAIGTVFVFLLFSIVVTAANEILLSLLDRRAAFLKLGLKELLNSDEATRINVSTLLNHGLIASLSREQFTEPPGYKEPWIGKQIVVIALPKFLNRWLGWDLGTTGVPSYIPGKSFVIALLSLLNPSAEEITPLAVTVEASRATPAPPVQDKAVPNVPPQDPMLPVAQNAAATVLNAAAAARVFSQDLHASILKLPPGKLRGSLVSLYKDADGDLEHFKANLENWYDESMDRVGGWYKRYAQQWLFVLALLLAVVCNVDSVRIIRALSTDHDLRLSIISQADRYTAAQAQSALPVKTADDHAKPAAVPTAPKLDTGAVTTASRTHLTGEQPGDAPALTSADAPARKIQNFKDAIADLGETNLPIGWNDPVVRRDFHCAGRRRLAVALSAVAGWFLTALAATLGAPFWFDLLNRFIDLRGVGRAPEEKDPTAPKKRATKVESYVESSDARKSV